jgi:signal transduction histidine kinase
LIFFSISCNQNNTVVSKKKETLAFDKKYIDALEQSKKEKYLDSSLNLLKQYKNDSILRNLYLNIATEYFYLNNLKKSLSISLKALQLSRQASDNKTMSKALYYVGDCYANSRNDSAYFYYLQAEKLFLKMHDYDHVGRMLFNKGLVLFYDGNYVECEVEVSKALHLLKKSSNQRLIYSCNTLMGNCLEKLVNYDEALRYHKLALRDLEKMKINDKDRDEINNYNVSSIINICNLYDLKGEYVRSITELQHLLSKDLRKKWPRLYANVLSNLAYSKMKNGNYDNVDLMFNESLKIVDSIGAESDILYKKIHIGEYFLTQKDTLKSIQSLKEANQLAIKIKSSNEILTSLKLLLKLDKKNRLFFANEYIEVSDSINTVQKNAYNKYARIEYETSKIEDQNKVLTKRNFYNLIISFSIIILLMLLITLIYLKYKNKKLQFLEKQQKANEEISQLLTEQHEKINIAKENEKTRIAKELHDGVMNKIYGIRMNLGFLNSKLDEKVIEKRKGYIFELQNVENEIRTISHELTHSSFLDDSDFNILLSSLIESQKEISSTKFNLLIDETFDWKNIQNIYKINLYRIIQEAIFNINKYSKAKNCNIKIQKIGKNLLKLSVTDDGVGFDLINVKKGIGLKNIKERADSLRGQFELKSKIGEGSEVIILFNLDKID